MWACKRSNAVGLTSIVDRRKVSLPVLVYSERAYDDLSNGIVRAYTFLVSLVVFLVHSSYDYVIAVLNCIELFSTVLLLYI